MRHRAIPMASPQPASVAWIAGLLGLASLDWRPRRDHGGWGAGRAPLPARSCFVPVMFFFTAAVPSSSGSAGDEARRRPWAKVAMPSRSPRASRRRFSPSSRPCAARVAAVGDRIDFARVARAGEACGNPGLRSEISTLERAYSDNESGIAPSWMSLSPRRSYRHKRYSLCVTADFRLARTFLPGSRQGLAAIVESFASTGDPVCQGRIDRQPWRTHHTALGLGGRGV